MGSGNISYVTGVEVGYVQVFLTSGSHQSSRLESSLALLGLKMYLYNKNLHLLIKNFYICDNRFLSYSIFSVRSPLSHGDSKKIRTPTVKYTTLYPRRTSSIISYLFGSLFTLPNHIKSLRVNRGCSRHTTSVYFLGGFYKVYPFLVPLRSFQVAPYTRVFYLTKTNQRRSSSRSLIYLTSLLLSLS